jgi:hypothetical protein
MSNIKTTAAHAAATLFVLAAAAAPASAAPAGDKPNVESRLQENWRVQIAATPVPGAGCFTAEYPSHTWRQVACAKAPLRPYIPRTGARAAGTQTVGNGADYAAVAHGKITTATGSFPTVTGLTSETDGGQKNVYSIQLNSNFFTSAVCKGSSDPSNCQGWEQFVYSSSSEQSFIQYWLINYGNTCPTTPYNDWNQYQGSCYRNSTGVNIPQEPATALATIKLAGTVTSTKDTFVTTVGTKAYSTGGNDNVVDLAAGWAANEFNVVGDGGGSEAVFNKGTSITVELAQKDGTTKAPTCTANDGTTGETNNLTLGTCTATGGSTPYITFKESK